VCCDPFSADYVEEMFVVFVMMPAVVMVLERLSLAYPSCCQFLIVFDLEKKPTQMMRLITVYDW